MLRYCILYVVFMLFYPCSLAAQQVISITIHGSINPVAADFIHNAIAKAAHDKAECLVIHLNTPGGLLKSTRMIVSDILESPVPVVVYVAPGGAHAGSAGVFITLAAHIAAMAPGTNIGAAHPVNMQGQVDSTMNEKITNDAAAFIRTIAEKRNRNMVWAEQAVRSSYAYTETEALEDSAIDLVAGNEAELLRRIDGRTVALSSGATTLHTAAAPVEIVEMTIWEKILDVLSNPDIAYIMLMLGMYSILFELYSPGAILPGITGVIALVLAFYSMHSLPVNYTGIALVIFAIILFLLEIKIVSHGLLAIGGIISLLLGSMMLIKSGSPLELVRISTEVIISATLLTAFFFLVIVAFGIKAQRLQPVTGKEGLIGAVGEVVDMLAPAGTIYVQGELWNAVSIAGNIGKGEKVRVTSMQQLTVYVAPVTHH